jgi:hypothetical protein
LWRKIAHSGDVDEAVHDVRKAVGNEDYIAHNVSLTADNAGQPVHGMRVDTRPARRSSDKNQKNGTGAFDKPRGQAYIEYRHRLSKRSESSQA